MIGKLTGIIDSIYRDHILLDVAGVGYLVFASPRTLSRIGRAGDRASLLIHTHVREDVIQLFGFADQVEQQWFNLLTTVQGVGNKVGLAILGVCPPERLALIIAAQDKGALTQADGVGPKLAARILTELKDKAGDIALGSGAIGQAVAGAGAISASTIKASPTGKTAANHDGGGDDGLLMDAVSALINLGYSRSEAYGAVSAILSRSPDLKDIGQVIQMGLKELAA